MRWLSFNSLPAEAVELLLDALIFLPQLGRRAEKPGLQGAFDEGMSHIEQLVAAEAVLFIAQTHAFQLVAGAVAPHDGEIVGAGGELDVAGRTLGLGVDHPKLADLLDLFDGNFSHKASPSDMIAHLPEKSKCFSQADSRRVGFFMIF